jgi:hypothetical protein
MKTVKSKRSVIPDAAFGPPGGGLASQATGVETPSGLSTRRVLFMSLRMDAASSQSDSDNRAQAVELQTFKGTSRST